MSRIDWTKLNPFRKISKDKAVNFLIRYILFIVIALIAALAGEALCNARLLRLSHNEKGVKEITSYTLEDNKAVVDLGGQYVDKFVYKFDYHNKIDAEINVYALNGLGVEELYEMEDHCSSVLNESVVNIGRNVNKIEISFITDSTMEHIGFAPVSCLKGFEVDNTVDFNIYRMGFIFVAVFLGLFLFFERRRLVKRIEVIFLVLSMTTGLFMIFGLPTSKVGWDEEIHFFRSYALSTYPGAIEIDEDLANWFVASQDTWPYNVPDSIEERDDYADYFNENCSYEEIDLHMESGLGFPYFTGYIAQALMIKLARKLGCSFVMMYMLGRLGKLLVYCILMMLAIKKTPRGKWLMAIIGLMPTTLFLACTYSYDATIICFMYLAIAYFLNMLLVADYKFRWRDYFIMGASFAIACLPKSVYAPLVLLVLILPKRIFKDSRQMWLAKGGMAVLSILMVALNILPTVISPSDVGDSRGGDTSEAGQMSYILGHPFSYAGILFNNFKRTFNGYFAGNGIFGLLGHLDAGNYTCWFYTLVAGVIMTDTVKKEEQERILQLKKEHKIAIFVVVMMIVALIWTALYMSFTEPGRSIINGVQGRYYIPFIFLVYLLFDNRKLQNSFRPEWYNTVVAACSEGLLLYVIWQGIISTHCL